MNKRRKYERMLYKCPEIDCYDVLKKPLVSEESFLFMEDCFKTDESSVHVFPFISQNAEGEKFLDIYVWDIALLYPHGSAFRRFIICEGYQFCEEEEDLFFLYLNGNFVSWDIVDLYVLNSDIQKAFPGWHVIRYRSSELDRLLAHCYFASHRCGPRETLYKSLPHIGYNLDKLPTFNLLGTNPVSIIGYGLPLRLLQILDENPNLLSRLYDVKSIEKCKRAYLKFCGYISSDRFPTEAQYEYLEDIVENGRFAKYGFNRTIYYQLGRGDYNCLNMYADFLYLREQVAEVSHVPEVRKMKIPSLSEVESYVSKLRLIANSETSYKEENRLIMERKATEKVVFEYRGEKYCTVMPESVADFYKEGIVQGNCLLTENYATSHARQLTTVVFLRRNNCIEEPFVTLEIESNEIIQARGRFNSLPSRDVFVFLEAYSEARSLVFRPYSLIMECVDDIDDIDDDDLREYAENHKNPATKEAELEVTRMVFEALDDMLTFDLSSYEIIIHDEDSG